MTADPDEAVSVDVDMPVSLFADLDSYAVAHDLSYDAAVTDAIDRLSERTA
jgi:hypothetical protein